MTTEYSIVALEPIPKPGVQGIHERTLETGYDSYGQAVSFTGYALRNSVYKNVISFRIYSNTRGYDALVCEIPNSERAYEPSKGGVA